MNSLILDSINDQLEMIRDTRLLMMQMLAKKGKTHEHIQILRETIEVDKREEQRLLNERDRLQQKTTRTGGHSGLDEVSTDNAPKV